MKFAGFCAERMRCSMLVIAMSVFTSLSMPAVAGDSWWQKGAELLKGATSQSSGGVAGLSTQEIAAGLKEALTVGTGRVVSQLGKPDGFNADPLIHIPLPDNLKKVQDTMNKIGMGGMMNELELKLNQAAETATPQAKELFLDAISKMTLDDVTGIYKGADDAATQYFRGKMSEPLKAKMAPIVEQSLSEVGAVKTYDSVMSRYGQIPFVPDVKADLQNHVLEKGLDGIFHYVAEEEAAIRANPAARTTEILKKVFGASAD